MPPPRPKGPRVKASLPLHKFAHARVSGHDARAARAAAAGRAAKRVNALKKLKTRLAAEGRLQVRVCVKRVGRGGGPVVGVGSVPSPCPAAGG